MEINGLDLGEDFYMENTKGHSGIDSRVVRTRDNSVKVFEQSFGVKVFDLVGGDNFATLTGAQIDALMVMAAVIGATYTLEYNYVSSTFRFRNEDQPVIEHDPLGPREKMTATAIYRNVRIKCMEA